MKEEAIELSPPRTPSDSESRYPSSPTNSSAGAMKGNTTESDVLIRDREGTTSSQDINNNNATKEATTRKLSDPESNTPSRTEDQEGGDIFGDEEGHDIKYRTLEWGMVAVLMIAEVISNGMLSLPSSAGVVGLVPNIIIILFLGLFGTYTSYLLVQFKLNHPEVQSMGDAGYILFGPIGRELFYAGTIGLSIFAAGGHLLSGQLALQALTNNKLCRILLVGIFAIPTIIGAFPRTLDRIYWISIPSALSIAVAGIVAMIGAGLNPIPGHVVSAFLSPSFYHAFIAITNPVFSYAGHFLFFIMISEMKNPKDAMKAAYTLQAVATSLYLSFAVVIYCYLGNDVQSPSFLSLPEKWMKAAFGIGFPSFLVAGCIISHLGAKLIFLRIFKKGSKHIYNHTLVGYSVWAVVLVGIVGIGFMLASAVPIFSDLIGIPASLFASWFTYGIAGVFWLHDSYYLMKDRNGEIMKSRAWRQHPFQFVLSILTILVGGFICVAGTYVTIRNVIEAYSSGRIGAPFSC